MKTNTYPEFTNYFGETVKLDWAENSVKQDVQLPIDHTTRELVTVSNDISDNELKHITKLSISTLFRTFIDYLYPIGAIYISADKTFNPNESLTGNWSRLQSGYLYASDSNNTYVGEGVQGSNLITEANLPAHMHNMEHTHTGSTSTYNLNFSFQMVGTEDYDEDDKSLLRIMHPISKNITASDKISSDNWYYTIQTSADKRQASVKYSFKEDITHSITTSTQNTNNTGSTGSNSPFMPAYHALIVWKRIS